MIDLIWAASLPLCLAGGLAYTHHRAAGGLSARVTIALAMCSIAALHLVFSNAIWQYGREHGPCYVAFVLGRLDVVSYSSFLDPEWTPFAVFVTFNIAIVLTLCLAIDARIGCIRRPCGRGKNNVAAVYHRTDKKTMAVLNHWEPEAKDILADSWSDNAQVVRLDPRILSQPTPPLLLPCCSEPSLTISRAGVTDLAEQGPRKGASAGTTSKKSAAAGCHLRGSQVSGRSLTSRGSSTPFLSPIVEEEVAASLGGGVGRFTPSRARRLREFRRRWLATYRAFRVWSACENLPPRM